MGVGAGQQEFDRHDSGDMASGAAVRPAPGTRQAGARAAPRRSSSLVIVGPDGHRAAGPQDQAGLHLGPGFRDVRGRPLTDEGQRPRVAVGPTPTGRPPESGCRSPSSGSAAAPMAPEEAVLEIPMSLQVGRLAGRRRTLGRITAAHCQVACRVHGLGVRARLTVALVGSGCADASGRRPLLALSAPSYDLGSC
jgi:hypothetical protein